MTIRLNAFRRGFARGLNMELTMGSCVSCLRIDGTMPAENEETEHAVCHPGCDHIFSD